MFIIDDIACLGSFLFYMSFYSFYKLLRKMLCTDGVTNGHSVGNFFKLFLLIHFKPSERSSVALTNELYFHR